MLPLGDVETVVKSSQKKIGETYKVLRNIETG